MSDTQVSSPKRKKKWTLMFFFASDNILSPSMLSQIKAIKAAGYQKDTNVLLHFDPNEKGAPTRVFEIHRSDRRQNKESSIGDCSGPLAWVLTSDDITPKKVAREQIDAVQAAGALKDFLTLCREQYPADHYMLFMIGHGMVVGRDAFLPDDNPISAIGLRQLGEILTEFSQEIKTHDGILELIGMHSCSMSGVEVAFELQGTANYMMASQGISFIGAWPYRQLLIKIYNAIDAEPDDGSEPVNVLKLAEEMHDLCIQHSADFMVGGYAADLCLCTLKHENVRNLSDPIKGLALALKDGLEDSRCRDLILLAHWKSQSYWHETYTDLFDFCLCLRRLCVKREERRPPLKDTDPPRRLRRYDERQKAIEDACQSVMTMLEPRQPTDVNGPVIRTDFIGAGTQYSHGLSIYFPWTEPIEDKNEGALTNYSDYLFTSAASPWLEFLKLYFTKTQRPDRLTEDRQFRDVDLSYQTGPGFEAALKEARSAFSIPGVQIGTPQSVPSTGLDGKVSPPDAGGDCFCPSIKNYSREFLMSDGPSVVFGASRSPRDSDKNPGSSDSIAA